jgi:hypothetical protein
MPERTQPPTRTSAEIDDRIARLAIIAHFTEDAETRAVLLAQAGALYWANTNDDTTWAEAQTGVLAYMTETLIEEGLQEEGATP